MRRAIVMGAAVTAFAVGSSATDSFGGTRYTVTDLGSLGGFSFGSAVNNGGEVAGYSYTTDKDIRGDTTYRAYVYSGGVMHDFIPDAWTYSYATGINASGDVVGTALPPFDNMRAFVYHGGTMTYLGPSFDARAINDSGVVAGFAALPGNASVHAVTYSDGTLKDLGTLGGNQSYAYAINAVGQVVGESSVTGDSPNHAFLYSDGSMIDLGTFGGAASHALAINAAGQVVGDADTAGGRPHAFRYADGRMTDLGTLGGPGSGATGINARGQIVGYAYIDDSDVHAFLYEDGAMIDLNALVPPDSGWELIRAAAINDVGQIVVGAANASNQGHALLLTPVPEPTVVSLVGVAGVGWLLRARRRRVEGDRCA